MLKKLKGVIIVAILTLASVMMPFNIYADILPSSALIGVQLDLDNIADINTSVNPHTRLFTYDITVRLSDNYVGWAQIDIPISYYFNNGTTSSLQTSTPRLRFWFNGNVSHSTYTISTRYDNDPIINKNPAGTIYDSNVSLISDLDSIQQIIDILTDTNNYIDELEGYSSSMVTNLQNILTKCNELGVKLDLSNEYLEEISKWTYWNFPIESFSAVSRFLDGNYYSIGKYELLNYYTWPMFKIAYTNISVMQEALYKPSVPNDEYGNEAYFIFMTHMSSTSKFNDYFTLTNGTVKEIKRLFNANLIIPGDTQVTSWGCYKVTVEYSGSGDRGTVRLNNIVNPLYFIPIYRGTNTRTEISTDFALRFGLSNKLLDDLDIIANGTISSNQANNDLNTASSQFTEQSDNVIGVEENITNNFESQVQNIDINTGLSGFGGNFMTSATWVRTQFDRLTNSNPYGSLVTFGLTLGFALLMLGKVLL